MFSILFRRLYLVKELKNGLYLASHNWLTIWKRIQAEKVTYFSSIVSVKII